jgi:hypothetical protein
MPPCETLRPLYSGGLWEAVTMTPSMPLPPSLAVSQ